MVAIAHPTTPRPLFPGRTAPRTESVSAATYRRRRLVAAGLALLLLVAVVVGGSRVLGGPAGAVDRVRPVAELSVLVEPGDTVWSIAESLAGDGDVRPVVDAIVEANGGADLVAGDRLLVALP